MNSNDANSIDLELAGKLIQGGGAAFTALVTQYADWLHHFIFSICNQKELTEEVVQEVFTRKNSVLKILKFEPPFSMRSSG